MALNYKDLMNKCKTVHKLFIEEANIIWHTLNTGDKQYMHDTQSYKTYTAHWDDSDVFLDNLTYHST